MKATKLITTLILLLITSCAQPFEGVKHDIQGLPLVIHEFEYKGHTYIYFQNEVTIKADKLFHAPHCQCYNNDQPNQIAY